MPLFRQKWLEQAVFWPHLADGKVATGTEGTASAEGASGAELAARVSGMKTISEPPSSNANLNLSHLR